MYLISREAVLKHLNDVWFTNTPSISDSKGTHAIQAAKADGIAISMSVIEGFKTVPAVPLDKLCEWLAGYAEPPLDALTMCDNPFEAWKMTLTEWMEEQDAAD